MLCHYSSTPDIDAIYLRWQDVESVAVYVVDSAVFSQALSVVVHAHHERKGVEMDHLKPFLAECRRWMNVGSGRHREVQNELT